MNKEYDYKQNTVLDPFRCECQLKSEPPCSLETEPLVLI